MSRGSEWYARHKDERTIKMGDRMRVLSLIHNAHAAATELLDDAVVRDGGMLGWAAKKVNHDRGRCGATAKVLQPLKATLKRNAVFLSHSPLDIS